MNTQYNCKIQKLVSQGQYWKGCMNCKADAINNPKCKDYVPVNVSVLRTFIAVNRLECEVEK